MTEPLCLSVIVPTLNEAANLPGCLASVRCQDRCAQVIVADGGSTDGTRRLARQLGAEVVPSAPGRGLQIHTGLQRARGAVVLVLHADCRLTPGAAARIRAVLTADPRVVGGALGMRFSSGGNRQRLIAGLNNLRARVSGIAFGDQGQFFRHGALARAGGFPAQMLMEDVELSLRLKRAGRVVLLPGGIQASARRWRRERFAGRIAVVLALCGRYLLERARGVDPGRAERYYRSYYGHDPPIEPGTPREDPSMNDIGLREYQQRIDRWVREYGVRYFSELTNMAILAEEVGEVARIMARCFGDQSAREDEAPPDLADELADVLFVVGCLANQTGIDLSRAVTRNLDKKTRRDRLRHRRNPKLASREPQEESP